jgi:hypothetical protein
VDQVAPGTWIVAEVIGGFGVTLGAQLGYDFNWVREARLGGLTGDIGLRLQMGINAAVGFSASGRCAVVVSRDSDEKNLRLRFFRLKTREFDLSLDASLGIEAVDKLLPGKVDDFISAVFDTHGQQILKDIKVIEDQTAGKRGIAGRVTCGRPDNRSMQQNSRSFRNGTMPTILKLVEEKVDR